MLIGAATVVSMMAGLFEHYSGDPTNPYAKWRYLNVAERAGRVE
jgi:hypothetical protein